MVTTYVISSGSNKIDLIYVYVRARRHHSRDTKKKNKRKKFYLTVHYINNVYSGH